MKATITPPQERMVTLVMTESDAETLRSIAPNIGYKAIRDIGGNNDIAMKGEKLFLSINYALWDMKEEAHE